MTGRPEGPAAPGLHKPLAGKERNVFVRGEDGLAQGRPAWFFEGRTRLEPAKCHHPFPRKMRTNPIAGVAESRKVDRFGRRPAVDGLARFKQDSLSVSLQRSMKH